MSFDGPAVQNAIYTGGAEWPITPADWERRAESALEPEAFGYIAGGAGDELTMRANREAFERRRLRPRMPTGNSERDLSVEVLGTRSAARSAPTHCSSAARTRTGLPPAARPGSRP